jgi:hypothetical protein
MRLSLSYHQTSSPTLLINSNESSINRPPPRPRLAQLPVLPLVPARNGRERRPHLALPQLGGAIGLLPLVPTITSGFVPLAAAFRSALSKSV